MLALAAIWGAIWNRLRGGPFGKIVRAFGFPDPGDTLTRLAFGLAFATIGVVASRNWWVLATAITWWAGCVLPWWKTIDLGRIEGSWKRDVPMMALRGLLWVAPTAVLLWLMGYFWSPLLLAGVAFPLLYEIGWRIPSQIDDLRTGPEIGECLAGAAMCTAFVYSVSHDPGPSPVAGWLPHITALLQRI